MIKSHHLAILSSLLLIIAALPALGAKRPPQERDMGAYLMVFHKDDTHSLYMALSYDGYRWTALNDGEPVIAGDTIATQHGIRDPHIFRAPDGTFYLAMTDLNIYARQAGYRDTEWERDGDLYGWGNNRGLVLMRSDDLLHWQRANIDFSQLPGWDDIGCVWAPETACDYDTGRLMLYYTMRHGKDMTRLYYSYVSDSYDTLLTQPEILFTYPKPDREAIDGDITRTPDGVYHLMYCSHDGTAGIKQATSRAINGGWEYIDDYCDFEKGGCEAPHVYKIIGEDRWILMYDCYRRKPHYFGFAETTDFTTFRDLGQFDRGKLTRTNFTGQKHGAVCWLTKKEARRLERYWAKNKRKYTLKNRN